MTNKEHIVQSLFNKHKERDTKRLHCKNNILACRHYVFAVAWVYVNQKLHLTKIFSYLILFGEPNWCDILLVYHQSDVIFLIYLLYTTRCFFTGLPPLCICCRMSLCKPKITFDKNLFLLDTFWRTKLMRYTPSISPEWCDFSYISTIYNAMFF